MTRRLHAQGRGNILGSGVPSKARFSPGGGVFLSKKAGFRVAMVPGSEGLKGRR